jgi:hypothetical protein
MTLPIESQTWLILDALQPRQANLSIFPANSANNLGFSENWGHTPKSNHKSSSSGKNKNIT